MNAQYIARMPADELIARALPFSPFGVPEPATAHRAVELHRPRVRTTIEMGRALSSYVQDPSEYDPEGLKKHVKPDTALHLAALAARLEAIPAWSAASSEAALRETAEQAGVAAGKLIHPTRLALTGTTVGAPLFDVVELLGKETTLRRLKRFVETARATAPGPLPAAD